MALVRGGSSISGYRGRGGTARRHDILRILNIYGVSFLYDETPLPQTKEPILSYAEGTWSAGVTP